MRHGVLSTAVFLLASAGTIHAQERIAAPPPDPFPPGALAPAAPIAPAAVTPLPTMPYLQAPPSGMNAQPSAQYPQGPAAINTQQIAPYPQASTPGGADQQPYGNYPAADGQYAPAGPYPQYPPPAMYGPPPGMYGGPPPGMYGPPPGAYGPPPRIVLLDSANPRLWVGLDILLWWTKNQPLSPFAVTSGPASQGANAGGLGVAGTTSLTSPLNFGDRGGARLFLGGWFDSGHRVGMDASFFSLGQQVAGFNVVDRSGTGNFVINEPVNGAPFITQVSAPGFQTGNVAVNATTQFDGQDVNALLNLVRTNGWTVNLLGGARFLQMNESLSLSANSNVFTTSTFTDNLGNVLATATPGSQINVLDQFVAHNQFYGGQLGAQVQFNSGRWFFGATGKMAIGDTHETVTVNGSTTVSPANGTPVFLNGGNYATLQTGRYTNDVFAMASELQLSLGYQVTPTLRCMMGYNLMLLSAVARPGNQIDNLYDGVTHPLVPMASSTFWAQGMNITLLFNF